MRYLGAIKKFHGHIGPFVVLGYRIGTAVKGKIGPISRIYYYGLLRPPHSCLVDGLQLSTGCTIGRGELHIHKAAQINKIVFYTKKRSLNVRIQDNMLSLMVRQPRFALAQLKIKPINTLINIT